MTAPVAPIRAASLPTRLALLAFAGLLAGPALRAEIAPEQLTWANEYGVPSHVGMAGRAQYWLVVDREGDRGMKAFWEMAGRVHDKLLSDLRVVTVAVAINRGFEPKKESDRDGNRWLHAEDPGGDLLRVLAGDATAVSVLVDGDGRVVEITRGADEPLYKRLDALIQAAQPQVPVSDLPKDSKALSEALRAGDLKLADKAARKSADAPVAFKALSERLKELAQADAGRVSDLTQNSPTRFVAWLRLGRLCAERPALASDATVAAALKTGRTDAEIKRENGGWAAFQDYLATMRKTPPKKQADYQKAAIAGIIEHHGGTYAAELATLIKAAAKLE